MTSYGKTTEWLKGIKVREEPDHLTPEQADRGSQILIGICNYVEKRRRQKVEELERSGELSTGNYPIEYDIIWNDLGAIQRDLIIEAKNPVYT